MVRIMCLVPTARNSELWKILSLKPGGDENIGLVLSTKNSGLWKVLSLKPGVGQNIALHASPTAKNSAFMVHLILLLWFSFQ